MNVIKDFLGVNVAYTGINGVRSAMIPANTNIFPRALDEQDNWQLRFRVHGASIPDRLIMDV
jgi:hypothetical protein